MALQDFLDVNVLSTKRWEIQTDKRHENLLDYEAQILQDSQHRSAARRMQETCIAAGGTERGAEIIDLRGASSAASAGSASIHMIKFRSTPIFDLAVLRCGIL